MVLDSASDPIMEPTETTESTERVKRITTAAVLASLSIAIAPVVAVIPRLPGWQIAFFDPVSLFWIAAFLIGGLEVGLVCSAAGAFGILFYDPTGFIGPTLKLVATLTMIVVPWIAAKRLSKQSTGKFFSTSTRYFPLMFGGYLIRLAVMIPLNLIVVPLFFGPWPIDQIIIFTATINTFQSLMDALIPHIIVHKTPVFKNFGMW